MKYQVVIASPEMLQSRSFINRLLRKPDFAHRVLSLVIDEAHCISLWGADFRKKYGTLGIIRAFLPRNTPVVAVTATLTGRVRRDIESKLHFAKQGTIFLNEGNDRPNVSIVVRACEYPLNSFADLNFILPSTIRCHTDIPKTYVYVDSINTGSDLIDYIANCIEERIARESSCRSLGRGLVRPFNATLSKDYRKVAMAHFRSGDIRILVCTDAAGMVSPSVLCVLTSYCNSTALIGY